MTALSSGRVDMLHGSLAKNILRFALPIVAAGLLQRAFNAFDVIMLGQFAGDDALAAVTSTLSLLDFVIDLSTGLAMGVNVAAAQALGRGDGERARKIAHTSVLLGLIFGGVMMLVQLAMAPVLLGWMGSPADVLPLSALYLRIYALGLPAFLLYHFGAALLRASGDTRRPTLYLILAGAVKLGLNLLFVALLRWGVAGAAASSALSNLFAGGMVMLALAHESGPLRIDRRYLRLDGSCAGRIVAIGLPAGLQGVVIALSNITIQSSVNSLGKAAMAGFGAAASLEGFVWVSMNAFTQACLTFTSCNYGAGQLRRTDGTRRWCMLLSAVTGILIGWSFFLLRRPLLGIYVSGEDAIAAGLLRMNFLMPGYFISGVFDAMISYQRGLGSSTRPTVVSLLGMCAFRVLWVIFVFPHYHTAASLLVSYPVSWLLTLAGQTVCTLLVRRRVYAQAGASA